MADIMDLLPEYLDIGIAEGEMEEIVKGALMTQLKELKVGIARAIVQYRAFHLMENLEAANKTLGDVRKLKKQYHHFFAEYRRMDPEAAAALEERPKADAAQAESPKADASQDEDSEE